MRLGLTLSRLRAFPAQTSISLQLALIPTWVIKYFAKGLLSISREGRKIQISRLQEEILTAILIMEDSWKTKSPVGVQS